MLLVNNKFIVIMHKYNSVFIVVFTVSHFVVFVTLYTLPAWLLLILAGAVLVC